MKEDETRDGTEEIIEYIKEQPGIKEVVLDNEVKPEHVESNPLYEITLDNIAEAINKVINTLEVSGLHIGNWHVFRAHKQLTGLRNGLTKGRG